MSLNTRAFLQEHQRHGDDGEVTKALGSLPGDTPVYQYQSISHMEPTVHSLDPNHNEFCVFIDIPEKIINRDLDEKKLGIKTLYPDHNLIVIRMPSRAHNLAARWLVDNICKKLENMGINADEELEKTGTATFHGKEADEAIVPEKSRGSRPDNDGWPTVAIETGWSEWQQKLNQDAHAWLPPDGDARVAITIEMTTTRVMITRHRSMTDAHVITIQRALGNRRHCPIHVTGGPLVLSFEDILERPPDKDRNQHDLVFDEDELTVLARKVWQKVTRR